MAIYKHQNTQVEYLVSLYICCVTYLHSDNKAMKAVNLKAPKQNFDFFFGRK